MNKFTENYDLPNMDDYKESLLRNIIPEYSEPKFKCPDCGGGMCMNNFVVLTTCPPKNLYKCDKCGKVVSL